MLLLISGDPVEAPLSVRLVAAERWIRAQPEVLEGCLVIRAVALHLPQRRGAPTRLWTRARARGGSMGALYARGLKWRVGTGRVGVAHRRALARPRHERRSQPHVGYARAAPGHIARPP